MYRKLNICGGDNQFNAILLNLFPVEDLERNDGSAERPYLMPESLRKVLNKKNKTQPAE